MKYYVDEATIGVIEADSEEELLPFVESAGDLGYVVPAFPQLFDGVWSIRFMHTELKQILKEDVWAVITAVSEKAGKRGRPRKVTPTSANPRFEEHEHPRGPDGRFAHSSAATSNIVTKSHIDKKGRETTAVYSGPNEEFRLSLTRKFGEGPTLQVLMFNPSIGGHDKNDKTLINCETIAKKNGYGSIHVINLYTVREQTAAKVPAIADKGVVPLDLVRNKEATQTLVAYGKLKSGDAGQEAHTNNMLNELSKHTEVVTLHPDESKVLHPLWYHMFNLPAKLGKYKRG
jgi:hypothetical protein